MNAEFHLSGKTIETDRLILRPFEQTDLDDFFDPSISRLAPAAVSGKPDPV